MGTSFKAKFKGYSARERNEQKVSETELVRGNTGCLVLPEKGLLLQLRWKIIRT